MTEPQTPQEPTKDHPAPDSPDATVQLSAGAPTNPGLTLRLDPPPTSAVPPVLQPPPPAAWPPRPSPSRMPWILGVALLLGVAGVGGYLYWTRTPVPETPALHPAEEKVPPGVQIYLDQAKAGDPHAMRMLGVMYYYGLNVPQDREKGLAWYRRAADKGSSAAREDLAKLQQTGETR